MSVLFGPLSSESYVLFALVFGRGSPSSLIVHILSRIPKDTSTENGLRVRLL